MSKRDAEIWMWSQAVAVLARTERLHRQFFQPRRSRLVVSWEPPVDILETESEVVILLALPGVEPEMIEIAVDGADLVVAGVRNFPLALDNALIHRMELPHGRFERRVALPEGRYQEMRHEMVNGCLLIRLPKSA